MTHFPATARAVTEARVAKFPAARFPDMLARVPVLGPRLVGLLSDRIRDFTKLQDQQEKMAALGKISAGLAHELNNPAAAAQRAVASLRATFQTFRQAAARLDAQRTFSPTTGGHSRAGARTGRAAQHRHTDGFAGTQRLRRGGGGVPAASRSDASLGNGARACGRGLRSCLVRPCI